MVLVERSGGVKAIGMRIFYSLQIVCNPNNREWLESKTVSGYYFFHDFQVNSTK